MKRKCPRAIANPQSFERAFLSWSCSLKPSFLLIGSLTNIFQYVFWFAFFYSFTLYIRVLVFDWIYTVFCKRYRSFLSEYGSEPILWSYKQDILPEKMLNCGRFLKAVRFTFFNLDVSQKVNCFGVRESIFFLGVYSKHYSTIWSDFTSISVMFIHLSLKPTFEDSEVLVAKGRYVLSFCVWQYSILVHPLMSSLVFLKKNAFGFD